MKISFSGNYSVNHNTFGISFEAYLDGHRINCLVSQEALQDINPDRRMDTVEQQFLDNRAELEALAESKIRAALPDSISINSADVQG